MKNTYRQHKLLSRMERRLAQLAAKQRSRRGRLQLALAQCQPGDRRHDRVRCARSQ